MKLVEAAYFNHTATSSKDLKILSEENTISYTISSFFDGEKNTWGIVSVNSTSKDSISCAHQFIPNKKNLENNLEQTQMIHVIL